MLSTISRMFSTSEGSAQQVAEIVVDEDHSSINPPSCTQALLVVAAVDDICESIFRLIRDRNSFIFRFKGSHGDHRPKHLILRDDHITTDISEKRWLDKKPVLALFIRWQISLKRDLCTCVHTFLDITQNPLLLLLCNAGPT